MSNDSEKTNPGGPVDADPVFRELRRLNLRVESLLKISQDTYEEVLGLRPKVAQHSLEIDELKARVLILEKVARIERDSDL